MTPAVGHTRHIEGCWRPGTPAASCLRCRIASKEKVFERAVALPRLAQSCRCLVAELVLPGDGGMRGGESRLVTPAVLASGARARARSCGRAGAAARGHAGRARKRRTGRRGVRIAWRCAARGAASGQPLRPTQAAEQRLLEVDVGERRVALDDLGQSDARLIAQLEMTGAGQWFFGEGEGRGALRGEVARGGAA